MVFLVACFLFAFFRRSIGVDGLDCKLPCLYIATQQTLQRVSINDSTGLPIEDTKQIVYSGVNSSDYYTSLEIDPVNKQIYWGDLGNGRIFRSNLNGSQKIVLFHYGLGAPIGLTVDWSSNVFYWADGITKKIEVSDIDGKYRKILFSLNEGSRLTSLCAVPTLGYLYWADSGENPTIERSSLSGLDRKIIISTDLTWPNDITFDYGSERLYWIDSNMDKIESSDPDGNKRQTEFKIEINYRIKHSYSLAYLSIKKMAYVADWYSLYAKQEDGEQKTIKLYSQNSENEYHRLRLHQSLNLTTSSPCLTNEKVCSHLCLKYNETSFVCECPTGYVLDIQNKTQCISLNKSHTILFADSQSPRINRIISYENEVGYTMNSLPVPDPSHVQYPVGLDYSQQTGYIYWSDYKTDMIYRMLEDGSNFEQFLGIKTNSPGLEVDDVSNVIYWIGDNGTSIIMSSLNGKYHKHVITGLSGLQAIALYEEKGLIFYSDFRGSSLGRVNVDGTGILYVLSQESGRRLAISAIAIDKIEDHIYFTDTSGNSIESSDLNFDNYRLVIQDTVYQKGEFYLKESWKSVVKPYSIAALGDKIYWTDLSHKAIFVADKHSGGNIEYVTGGLHEPRDIHVYSLKQSTETRKRYIFSFDKNIYLRPLCYLNARCGVFSSSSTPNPELCPVGYKETNYGEICANCSDAVGRNFRCPCTNWKTCAQRGYGNIIGCPPKYPYMFFKVRECSRIIKPDLCPYNASLSCNNNHTTACQADDDCPVEQKCCLTTCGQKCMKPVTTSDHPCKINNGGCSHFCVRKETSFECDCPNDMTLSVENKTCIKSSVDKQNITDKCMKPFDHGPCYPIVPISRYYYNHKTKSCQLFPYGGCGGNENNFYTKEECEISCQGQCPIVLQDQMPGWDLRCNITETCKSDTDCPGNQLCCDMPCERRCQSSIPHEIPKCYQNKPMDLCNDSTWYYDMATHSCQSSPIGGCSGTSNKFKDEIACKDECSSVVCHQTPKSGPCKGSLARYYYDIKTNQCKSFYWGGCYPNDNNFLSYSACADHCVNVLATIKPVTPSLIIKTTSKPMTSDMKYSSPLTKSTEPSLTSTTKSTKPSLTSATTEPSLTSSTKSTESSLKSTTKSTESSLTSTTKSTESSLTSTTKSTESSLTSTTTKHNTQKTTQKRLPSLETATTPTTSKETTRQTTTSIVTTQQATMSTTASTQTAKLCNSSPCRNGGTCKDSCDRNGSCTFTCGCPEFYFGTTCNLNDNTNVLQVKFTKATPESVDVENLKSVIAKFTSMFCAKDGNCFGEEATRSNRKKRSSAVAMRSFSRDDVIIFNSSEDSKYLSFFLLLTNEGVVLNIKYLAEVFEVNGNVIATEAGLKEYIESKTQIFDKQTNNGQRTNTKLTSALTAVFVVLVLLAVLLIISFILKKRAERRNAAMSATNNTAVRMSFENNLYDDLYPNALDLQTYNDEANNISFSNPAFDTPRIQNGAIALIKDGKNVSVKNKDKEWVSFPDDNSNQLEKPPISSFVEAGITTPANEIEDMLNEAPPDYTSRAGTPFASPYTHGPSGEPLVGLGSLPTYSSIWDAGMPVVDDFSPRIAHQTTPNSGEQKIVYHVNVNSKEDGSNC